MKKYIISLLVLFLLVSTSLVYASNQVTEEFTVQQDSYQYMTDWSVHLTNQTPCEETSGPSYNYVESRSIEPSPLSGPMDSPWSMFGHDVVHTCRSNYSTENNSGVEVWRVRGDETGAVWGSALIDTDGLIYFGTMGSDGSLYALYPNGTRKWRFTVFANGLIRGTPAISEEGIMYIETWGGDHYFHALNLDDGTVEWSIKIEGSTVSSPSIAPDGTIYFGDNDHIIYALNPDGTEKWRYTTGDIVMGSPAICIQDGTIYIGSLDHYFYALYPNGTLRWRYATGDEIKGSASIAPDGTIYVPSFDRYLYALYPDGTLRWRMSTGDGLPAAGVALGKFGTIYVGTEMLRAYNPDGTLKWITDVQGDIVGTVPAVSADGTIYVSAGNSLVAVNPDGTEKWRNVISDEQIRSSPSIGSDDRVYVGSERGDYGYLHAFGPDVPKKIVIEQPKVGRRYLFGIDLGKTLLGNTIIIGSMNIKVSVNYLYDIESVHFYVDGVDQYNLTAYPFEWRMNQRYGNIFPFKHTLTVVGYYHGNYSWTESIDVMYLHFLK